MKWEVRALAEVASVGSGAGFPIAEQGKSSGDFPFLKVSDMNLPGNARTIERWNNVVTDEVRVRLRATAFPPGSVIFPKIGAAIGTNKKRLLTRACCVDNNVMAVVPDLAKLEPEFLYFLLLKKNISDFASDSNPPSIRKGAVENWLIEVPPIDQQRRIVDQLSRAEGIVRLRRQAQQKAAGLIPAIFADMFGDPATNPKGWPANRLRDLVDFQSGGTPSKARDDYWQGDVPWVSPKDMKRLALYDAIDHISSLVLAETSLKLVPVGSVLIVVRGMILAHTVPVAEARVPLTVNQDMKALIAKGTIQSTYLLWLLQVCHDRLLAQVTTAAHGTKKLDTARLEEMIIPVPPAAMQRAFEANVRRMEAIQQHQVDAAAKAEAAFAALLARAFAAAPAGAAVREAEEVGS